MDPESSVLERPVDVSSDGSCTAAPWWRGRFFPNACLIKSFRFDATGPDFVIPVDYLPTTPILRMAGDFFGPRAAPLLAEWHALWRAAIGEDVDAFVARVRPLFRASSERRTAEAVRRARESLDAGKLEGAANDLYAVLTRDDEEVLRDPTFHIVQDAARHLSLIRAGTPVAICFSFSFPRTQEEFVFVPDGSGGMVQAESGSHREARALRDLVAGQNAHNPYWSIPGFQDRAGRPMATTHGHRHLVVTILDMALQGHRKAFLKACRAKVGTWIVDLDGVDSPETATVRLREAMGDDLPSLYGGFPRANDMLVQGFVPFVREHRFLVVDHRVVASTASDRLLSVLDANPHRIIGEGLARLRRPAASRGAYDRGVADVVIDRPVLARMAWGARDLARAVRSHFGETSFEEGRFDCYCIDMGETEDGRVLPIEINSIRCGLYAADHHRVAAALTRRHARHAQPPKPPVAGMPMEDDDLPGGLDFLSEFEPVWVERVTNPSGSVTRPEVSAESLRADGIAAFPDVLGTDCLGHVPSPIGKTILRAFVPRIPTQSGITPYLVDGRTLHAALTAYLENPKTQDGMRSRIGSWDPATGIGTAWQWPLPVHRAIANVMGKPHLPDIVPADEAARIVMALDAHTTRIRLAAYGPPAFTLGLIALGGETDGAGGPEDLWDFCTAYVICGQLPPTRLVEAALAHSPPPLGLPPQVARAVSRSFEVANAAFALARARILGLDDMI